MSRNALPRLKNPQRIDYCLSHHPFQLSYVAWHEEAERREKRGMVQRKCPTCERWFWRDEYGPGWAEGESVIPRGEG